MIRQTQLNGLRRQAISLGVVEAVSLSPEALLCAIAHALDKRIWLAAQQQQLSNIEGYF